MIRTISLSLYRTNISLKIGIISYNGGVYLMSMISCDMIISKETGELMLTKLFYFTYFTLLLSVRITSGRIRHSHIVTCKIYFTKFYQNVGWESKI